MTINDKIKQILIDKNLTPSYFADEIGVQRSSISHILSGRNRPSFDIIQKIIRRFPELGYEWIMEEDTQQNNLTSQPVYPNRGAMRPTPDRFVSGTPSGSYAVPTRSIRQEIPPASTNLPAGEPPIEQVTMSEKRVERIMIFYTDGSFQEYTSNG